MALYDKASLVLIPSGTKAGKVFSQKPTSGDGDFDFTRSTYATRVNSQGLIEKERSNLLLQSNNFDTTWGSSNLNITSGQSGYDGSSDAWLLDISGGTGQQRIEQNVTASGVTSYSIYAKANTLDWLLLYVNGSPTTRGYFDVANGVVGQTANLIDSKIESVGSGWYRCTIVYDEPITNIRLYLAENDNDITQTSGSIYIQDAQLEQGLVATDYIETTTSAVYTGITDNVPRLDYDGDCPSLLLEPQRTNLMINSEYAGGYTTGGTGTITDNAETSPTNSNNAFVLNDTTSGNYFLISDNITFSSADYTLSLFIKKTVGAISNYAGVQLNTTRQYIIVDTTNGTYNEASLGVGVDANDNITIEDWNEDWWRVIVTNNFTSGTYRVAIWPAISPDGTSLNVSATGSNIFFGLQIEEGSYATSYIPTYGTSVTRNAEDLELPTLSTVFDSSGDYTVFFEHGRIHEGVEAQFLYIRNVSCCYITISAGGSGTFTIGLWDGTNYTAVIVNDENFVVGSPIKVIVRVQNSIPSVFVNGAERTVPDTSVVPRGFHLYQFNKNHRIYKELYFNEALTDQECIDLTT